MKKYLVTLTVLCIFCLVGFAQAGPATRSLVSFVHEDEVIVIPESGAYLQFNEQNGIEYYRWTVKEKEQFCSDEGLVDQTIPYDCSYCSDRRYRNKGECLEHHKSWIEKTCYKQDDACSDTYRNCRDAEDGAGTDLPDGLEPEDFAPPSCPGKFDMSKCYNIDSDTMFFEKDISIGYGTPGCEIPIEVLVYNACLNQTVQVRGAGHTFKPLESIDVEFRVFKLPDKNGVAQKLLLNTGWFSIPVNVDGTFTTELEGGYKFQDQESIKRDGPGAYKFTFRVKKPDGSIGVTRSKVIVHECAEVN